MVPRIPRGRPLGPLQLERKERKKSTGSSQSEATLNNTPRQGYGTLSPYPTFVRIGAVADKPLRAQEAFVAVREREIVRGWYMQGASTVEERLRFAWIPILTWKVPAEGGIQAVCHGWSKTVYILSRGQLTSEWCYEYYYHQPAKQLKELSFDTWLGDLYLADRLCLDNSLWEWIQYKFPGQARLNEPEIPTF